MDGVAEFDKQLFCRFPRLYAFSRMSAKHQVEKFQVELVESKKLPVVGLADRFLTCFAICLTILLIPVTVFFLFRVVQEYERVVVFRLGRIRRKPRGPGLIMLIPVIDTCYTIDTRVMSYNVPPQEVLTRDSVTIVVDAVVYYRVFNPENAVLNINNYNGSTQLLAATTLRNTLGTKTLAELLADRSGISQILKALMDVATHAWGIEVERIEFKDISLPPSMQRSMAAEAEARCEALANIVAAQGEQDASNILRVAADNMTPDTMQLRTLQTMRDMTDNSKSTVIVVPAQMFQDKDAALARGLRRF